MGSINNPIPLVSICCVTYNHEKFIAQCLDGFVVQKTSFAFEILVHEDASTDNTAIIVKEYETKYPHLFRCVFQTENQFKKQNTLTNILFPMSRGKYIALCEGDDYWTDSNRLQKQVEFLENNPAYSLSFGNALIGDITNSYNKKRFYLGSSDKLTFNPIDALGLGCPTLSMVFRRLSQLPDWFGKVKSGDYFFRLILSTKGKFYYHNEVFGVHRKHHAGTSRTNSKLEWYLNTAAGLADFKLICLPEQKAEVNRKIAEYYVYAFFFSLALSQKINMVRTLIKILTLPGFYTRKGLGNFRFLFKSIVIRKELYRFDIF